MLSLWPWLRWESLEDDLREEGVLRRDVELRCDCDLRADGERWRGDDL